MFANRPDRPTVYERTRWLYRTPAKTYEINQPLLSLRRTQKLNVRSRQPA
jgi:hypothetical protein